MVSKKFILRGTAKTEKEKREKIAIATLIASSPYISRKKKQTLIKQIK